MSRVQDSPRRESSSKSRTATASSAEGRLLYLDWLRGVAVLFMVLMHVTDAWTREANRTSDAFYALRFSGGVASGLFLFLAGVAAAMNAGSKGRATDHTAGARIVRRRGWEIFLLGLIFRVQAQVLGLGPLYNILRVDILNTMGLSIVLASLLWQHARRRTSRAAVFAAVLATVTFLTPIVRNTGWLAILPDPLEAYLRPAGPFAAFPMFPWMGFVFGGVLVGDLIDGFRAAGRRPGYLQWSLLGAGAAGVGLGWLASFQPSIYPHAEFWHDSPTLFFIRLGIVTMMVPLAWGLERGSPRAVFLPLVTFGRSSLFVYWIHVEMVYGVLAEPLKNALLLWQSLLGTALLCAFLYLLVLLKNWLLEGYQLPRRLRLFAAVLR